MRIAEIVSPWAGDGLSEPQRPAVTVNHPLPNWDNVTAEQPLPTDPNLVVIQVLCAPEVIDAIAADPNYGPACILSDEPAPAGPEAE